MMMNSSEPVRIGGTLVWYASICPRQVWLTSRGVEPDQEHDLLSLGRLIDEESYRRDRHSITFGDNRFDVIREENGTVVVAEIKKSSKASKAARLQVGHYLYELSKQGIEAEGALLFPTEKKKEKIILDTEMIQQLERLYQRIREIHVLDTPPPAVHCRYCKPCANREWCWS